ncbi:MAG TPA: ribonuclease Y [Erysipelothrix sp.]|nr:ribonuclease Y [Erysipelothrix sp.]
MPDQLFSVLVGFIGIILGFVIFMIFSRLNLIKTKREVEQLIETSNLKAETIIREAQLEGKTAVYELKLAAEKENKERKSELSAYESRLDRRENQVISREKVVLTNEKSLEDRTKHLNTKYLQLEKMEHELKEKIDSQIVELQRVSNLSIDEAKQQILQKVEYKMDEEIANYIRDREDEAKRTAELKAKDILATTIERFSQDEISERTVSVVHLPNEDMKGRIIGREGRNIRAIEAATGVDLIIDDTPEVIQISSFNPIRREIARKALEILIKDGRIQPGRIEEVVNKVSKEIDETIVKAGEDATFNLGIHRMDKELVKNIGRLKFRTSYGQNALQHSVEVAHMAGMMAAELGLNQNLAKRAGLLHDIGKALDFELEGTHVELGVRLAKKYGENQIVLNAIESHHGDVAKNHLISNLVAAADTLSAARPGARIESYENYIQRLEQLETISNRFEGVEQTYAIQAGREVRVMVVPDKISDAQATLLAREIRDAIENEMTYPGQIKVTVIREVRKQEIAK